ncbi:aminopeptidase [Hydrogenophaga sp.]|uniref:aminopeptidase n=1 Tax=Hydrogenophaga sp. TaxID=1904254 RepID=UPI002716F581|nr:aminopeptidase [Hydrogenophaga sp.]MDO8905555.1 aminopeptidase [Hydrogenophaga sp.]
MRLLRGVIALLFTASLTGCASPTTGVGYYWQSVTGHLQLMRSARPVEAWIEDEKTPAALKEQLATAQRIRTFAAEELALPDNASYRRYADLQRRAAVYNVVAAPALELTLNTWCFPVVGCVGYRGYYSESNAQAFADSLPRELDVAVYPVPAYSTLGWMNWAGGDPLLNTFIGYPEGELARIIFHELAHQVVYVKNDTMFNESFATAVERLGGARWLTQQADRKAKAEYAAFDARRREFRALTLAVRARLQALYADPSLDEAAQLQQKAEVMARFRQDYEDTKQRWGGFAGYDAWVARANNATFATQAAYDELVPGFEALFESNGGDFGRFYDAVRALSKRPRAERHEQLRRMATSDENTAVIRPDSHRQAS